MSDEAKATVPELTPLKESFSIQLKVNSDWHIGSGAGRPGDVDRLVLRDRNDLPYVPAKTLTGIWRDACEQVALGLDDGEPGAWSAWIPFLFGEQAGQPQQELKPKLPKDFEHPRGAALSVRSAHLPNELRLALKSKVAVRESITFVKPGISISPRSGRTKTDFLRFEEMARAGATLEADCRIDWSACTSEEEKRAATALLIAGARLIERIGGKRRRGVGRGVLVVDGRTEIEAALNCIESLGLPPNPPAISSSTESISLREATDGSWQAYELIVTTKTPVIIAARTTGNLIETTDYIPGSHLLSLISQQLRESAVNDAVVNGDLTVTNATIEVDGEPGRAVPFCLFQEKLGDGLKGKDKDKDKVYNRFREDTDGKPQVKGYRSGYVGKMAANALPLYFSVKREVEMHNIIQDEVQRPTDEVGGVFSYQAIKAGTILRAKLRLRASLVEKLTAAKPNWMERLAGEHRPGRSKKDDYGLIKLAIQEKKDETQNKDEPKIEQNGELSVWLLSDLLMRDERLRPVASIEQLRKKLEHELKLQEGGLTIREDASLKLLSRLSRQNRTDSWHIRWKLPRPSLVGLAAGTCVIFNVNGQLDKTLLAEIERTGLGERRAEGYGRIRFNDPLVASPLENAKRQAKGADSSSTGSEVIWVSSPDALGYARLIEREAVRREIGRKAVGFAGDPDQRRDKLGIKVEGAGENKKSKPPMSQLGALRSVIGRLRSAADRKTVTDWLEHLEDTSNRIEKWPDEGKEKKDGKILLKHLRALIEQEEHIWQLLGLTDLTKLTITETGAKELKSELWAEAVRALVDACVRAQKREVEKEDKDGEKN